jgi:UDP-N-acetylmuramate dehydrogenase
MKEVLQKELSSLVSLPVLWECSLKDYTSFCIGGPAEALVQINTLEELKQLLRFLQKNRMSWRIIGRGTNLLISDEGFAGVIVVLSGELQGFDLEEKDDMIYVEAGAGLGLTKLSSVCADRGFSGLEFAMGIPGTVGGAVVMNAGAWGKCMADVIVRVSVMTNEGEKIFRESDLKFAYRRWLNLSDEKECIVTSAKIRLIRKDVDETRKRCHQNRERRKAAQPVGAPNAGSIFKNPPGESAGRLIEASGLKGMAFGGAEVSVKHANFIVNTGGATAKDVHSLIDFIQKKVRLDSGIFLETEVHSL